MDRKREREREIFSASDLDVWFYFQEKSSYKSGKAVQQIKVVPRLNLTVTCTVSNRFGEDVKSINVSSGTVQPKSHQSIHPNERTNSVFVGCFYLFLLFV